MHYNQQQLVELLSSDDHPPDTAISNHLAKCSHCQLKLARLAGDDEDWSEFSDVLKDGIPGDETPRPTGDSSVVIMIDPSLAEDVPATCEPLSLDFLEEPSHPEMLGRLGRYEIERVIGTGGHGVVLKGFDTELHRPVAIKVLAPHLAGSGSARTRFAREAQAAAAIVHDHVIPIHDVASGEKLPYLVMPFVPGRSLQQRLDDDGPLPVKEIVRIAMQTAAGLAAAHAQGIIHRDVKPGNILLEDEVERVLISDFGLARTVDDASLTRSGIIAGTPQYMSPEQTRGEAVDAASDLFSLGSVIYTLCTGHSPFRADTTMGVLRKISDSQPRSIRELNSDVPYWLEWFTNRLLAKRPGDRFRSAREVAELLEQCLAHLHRPAETPLPKVLRELEPPVRRVRKRIWIIGGSVAAAMALLLVGFAVNGPWDGPARESESDPNANHTAASPETAAPNWDADNPNLQWNIGIDEALTELEYETELLEDEVEAPFIKPESPHAKEEQ